MSDEKKNDEDVLDLGIGKLKLGGIFDGIGKLVELASKLEEAGGEIKKEGELDLSKLKEGMKGVYGFTVKSALGDKPVVETFGNIKKTPKGPTVEEEREPLTDLFDEKDEVHVIAEIPGVLESDITVELKDDILVISASTEKRKYHKELLIPSKVNKESISTSYNNGVLEIKINKSK